MNKKNGIIIIMDNKCPYCNNILKTDKEIEEKICDVCNEIDKITREENIKIMYDYGMFNY